MIFTKLKPIYTKEEDYFWKFSSHTYKIIFDNLSLMAIRIGGTEKNMKCVRSRIHELALVFISLRR